MNLKVEYLSEILIKLETILPHCSVAQAGSNYEKNWRSKSRWTVPLRRYILQCFDPECKVEFLIL